MIIDLQEKLRILSDAAKYDVACTSSGNSRAAEKGKLGSAAAAGICHAFTGDGRCISLLKILMTNECVYDCRYCVNRRSNDVPRTTFTPEEICMLTIGFYRRNYIEGLFLSSGILKSPTYTMERMYETVYRLRYEFGFRGYIHVKGIPGADQTLIEKIGFLADRISMNAELPTDDGLKKLAPSKKPEQIIGSIGHIRDMIENDAHYGRSAYQSTRLRFEKGLFASDVQALWDTALPKELLTAETLHAPKAVTAPPAMKPSPAVPAALHTEDRKWLSGSRLSSFAPAGQSTQMIIGATNETDFDIIHRAESFYRQFDLKRVFYSAFINTTGDASLPDTSDGPPLLREHRLYQADFLLRYYGFRAAEIVDPAHPNLNPFIDPKCNWALNHLELFPVEVQTASYAMLLRVPGIGAKSAERIVKARHTGGLTFDALKHMGVVLKRAHYFILCQGKQMFRTQLSSAFILNEMLSMEQEKNWQIARNESFRQMDLFVDLWLGK
ncbi:MAG: putative DNA modification/repair radical SAM protein [Lachnospiraceae bacterium]|nr:putative DNA modification/repair radical SAM protein [Lachnospiraceae bacterium]